MAKNVFDPEKQYSVTLYAHSFRAPTLTWRPPKLPGTFEADTVEISNGYGEDNEFAVFHVAEPQENAFPALWVGVYRIPMNWLAVCPPEEI